MILHSGPVYEQGYAANREGYCRSENPYAESNVDWGLWDAGWIDRQHEDDEFDEWPLTDCGDEDE